MKLSVVIPARNEVDAIGSTLREVVAALTTAEIEHEVLVVDDSSTDGTADAVQAVAGQLRTVRLIRSPYRPGFGLAVCAGLEHFQGDAAAIFMADASDDPRDLVRYHQVLLEGFDCAFGSRFIAGAKVHDYPRVKLLINRLVNNFIRLLFRIDYNDTTNACKAYRREVIESIQPLISNHFNLTVEMPLKAIVRGYSHAVVPIAWRNRTTGESKLGLKEMGSRYLFSLLYVFLEHHLTRGDYRRGGFDGRVRRRGAGSATARAAGRPSALPPR
jgi:dolichol-phosphate mannosyltransferase